MFSASASVAPSTNCSASVPAWDELTPAGDELDSDANYLHYQNAQNQNLQD